MILVLAAAAGAVENNVVDPGVGVPEDPGQAVGGPGGDDPNPEESEPSPPAETSPAPAPSPAGQPTASTPGGRASSTGGAGVGDLPGQLTTAPQVSSPGQALARPFRVVSPARAASDGSPVTLPSGEPFGIVLAAAVIVLIGAAAGHTWAQATGRLDAAV